MVKNLYDFLAWKSIIVAPTKGTHKAAFFCRSLSVGVPRLIIHNANVILKNSASEQSDLPPKGWRMRRHKKTESKWSEKGGVSGTLVGIVNLRSLGGGIQKSHVA